MTAPKTLLIVDTETTGFTPAEGVCIEVGAILFHVPTRAILTQVSFLLPCQTNPVQDLNRIAPETTLVSQPCNDAIVLLGNMLGHADALVAHNAAFDRQWFGVKPLPALDAPWICTMSDIRWPGIKKGRPSVVDLALAHGVPVWDAHRALTDCTYLAQVFQRCENLEGLLQAALEPRQLYKALVSFDDRQLAKDAGFAWNDPVPKAWTCRLSASEVEALPFRAVLVPGQDAPKA